MRLLFLIKYVYNNNAHATLRCNLFHVMYNYDSELYFNIKNNFTKEKILITRERIRKIKEIREALNVR